SCLPSSCLVRVLTALTPTYISPLPLHDALPIYPGLLERLVEMDLLGGHGLRLHRHPGARPAADLEDDGARLRRRRREVHPPPEALDVPDQLLEVAIEVLQRRFLDLPRPVTEALTLGEGVDRLAAAP